jgi:transposase-like protein
MLLTTRIDHQHLEARRLRAAELFTAGVGQAKVARQVGVTRQSVHRWHDRWKLDDGPRYQPERGVSSSIRRG